MDAHTVTNIVYSNPNARNDAWIALMTRLIELAPKAEPDQLRVLAAAYRDLN